MLATYSITITLLSGHTEIDHVDGWALTRTTTIERLARLCRWHHYLKTHCGYRLDGRAGDWRFAPPDHPPDDVGGLDPPASDPPPFTSSAVGGRLFQTC